jgi:1-acylglycerone phosphate reductase
MPSMTCTSPTLANTSSFHHVFESCLGHWVQCWRSGLRNVRPSLTQCSPRNVDCRAEHFARRGCKVYATARNVERMDGLAPDIERLFLDVTIDASVDKAVAAIIEREGRIDILVNNAGFVHHSPLLDCDLEALRSILETNTISVLRMVQAVVPHMASRKSGLVVNISSLAGIV